MTKKEFANFIVIPKEFYFLTIFQFIPQNHIIVLSLLDKFVFHSE